MNDEEKGSGYPHPESEEPELETWALGDGL